MGRVSTFFDMDNILNEILSFLLANGREYIHGCISLEYAGIDRGAPINQSPDDDETMSIVDPDSPVPVTLLKVREYAVVDTKKMDISGSAAYRGLLALHMGLKIVRSVFHRVHGAWPVLIEVLCGLRDARALPAGLADLDDFADSNGDVLLPPSHDQRRLKIIACFCWCHVLEGARSLCTPNKQVTTRSASATTGGWPSRRETY